MSASNYLEAAVMNLVFLGQAWSGWAQNDVTAPDAYLALALCTGDPGEAGNMSTNEATYAGYARVDLPRDDTAWTVTGGAANPINPVVFPTVTGGSDVLTFFMVGRAGGGALDYLMAGECSPNTQVTAGRTPRLGVATTISLE